MSKKPKKIQPSPEAIAASDKFMREVAKYSLGDLTTERIRDLDLSGAVKSENGTVKALELMIAEEESVYQAVKHAHVAGDTGWLVEQFTSALSGNGRIVFLGAGAKLREAIFIEREWRNFINRLDTETRGQLPENIIGMVMGIGAGGDLAQIRTAEGMEDIGAVAEAEIRRLLDEFRTGGVDGPIMVVGHDSSGNSLYTVQALLTAADMDAAAVYAINNPAEEMAGIPRIRKLLDDNRIRKIHFMTGPPPIAGSTRLQPTTAGMAVFAPALLAAARRAFPVLKSRIGDEIPEKADISENIEEWTQLLKGAISELAAFIDLKAETYRNNIAFCGEHPGSGYLTFLSGRRAMLPVITNEVEEYPTFGTPPYATQDEIAQGTALSPSGILVEATDGNEALAILFGRQPRGLDLSELLPGEGLTAAYGTADKIPDLSRKSLAGFFFDHKTVWQTRPTGKGNMVAAVLMGDDVDGFLQPGSELRKKLADAAKRGAKTAILAITHYKIDKQKWPKVDSLLVVPVESDAISAKQSIVLKIILNIQSNIVMTKLNKVCGSLMFDVSPSNGKLVDRATRYVVHAFRNMLGQGIDYRTANRHLFDAMIYVKQARQTGATPSSPVKLTFVRIISGLSIKEADKLLKHEKGDLDAVVTHLR